MERTRRRIGNRLHAAQRLLSGVARRGARAAASAGAGRRSRFRVSLAARRRSVAPRARGAPAASVAGGRRRLAVVSPRDIRRDDASSRSRRARPRYAVGRSESARRAAPALRSAADRSDARAPRRAAVGLVGVRARRRAVARRRDANGRRARPSRARNPPARGRTERSFPVTTFRRSVARVARGLAGAVPRRRDGRVVHARADWSGERSALAALARDDERQRAQREHRDRRGLRHLDRRLLRLLGLRCGKTADHDDQVTAAERREQERAGQRVDRRALGSRARPTTRWPGGTPLDRHWLSPYAFSFFALFVSKRRTTPDRLVSHMFWETCPIPRERIHGPAYFAPTETKSAHPSVSVPAHPCGVGPPALLEKEGCAGASRKTARRYATRRDAKRIGSPDSRSLVPLTGSRRARSRAAPDPGTAA